MPGFVSMRNMASVWEVDSYYKIVEDREGITAPLNIGLHKLSCKLPTPPLPPRPTFHFASYLNGGLTLCHNRQMPSL